MKTLEKVQDTKLRRVLKILENKFCFGPEKSTQYAIFIMRHLREKTLVKKGKLIHVFVDLENTFDRIPMKAIKWPLRRQVVSEHLVNLVVMLYVGSKSKVRAAEVMSEEFP